MSNFSINFTYWWLMFLLIPAVFFTLLPYFRMAKRYRRTRNRILSITFHIAIMVMCISILSGMTFSYTIPNTTNEIVVLVDVSYSNKEMEESKIEFVEELIDKSKGHYNIGIVAFAKNPYTVVDMTRNTDNLYGSLKRFLASENSKNEPLKEVRTNATDFATALTHAQKLFTNPEKGKIVVVSDGIETDNDASRTIKTIASSGIRIDTMLIGNPNNNEVQITGVDVNDSNFQIAQNITVTVTVTSSKACTVNLLIEDEVTKESTGDVETIDVQPIEKRRLYEGDNEITVEVKSVAGLHKLHFELEAGELIASKDEDKDEDDEEANDEADTVTFNNDYYSHFYLKNLNKLLIIESEDNESDALVAALKAEDPEEFEITVANIKRDSNIPQNMDAMRDYPQTVLVNVSASDMLSVTRNINGSTVSFDKMLHSYANDYGGSVLVTGGFNGGVDQLTGLPLSSSFSKDDIANSKEYEAMLPIKVTSYTPAMAVMVVFDRSGSIRSSYLDAAKAGVIKYLESEDSHITYRDYIGIMSFESSYTMDAELMSMRNLEKIKTTITNIQKGDATVYSGALQRAGMALANQKNVKKRQIIFITDGEPHDKLDVSDSSMQPYGPIIKSNFQQGITLSVISFEKGRYADEVEKGAVEYGGGKYVELNGEEQLRGDGVTSGEAANVIYEAMKEAVLFDEVNEFNDMTVEGKSSFTPSINRSADIDLAASIDVNALGKLSGYFGSYEKSGAEIVLSAPNSPLYTKWNFGHGKVGVFAAPITSDLSASKYTGEFMANEESQKLLRNLIKSLMPSNEIKSDEVWATMTEDNFTTALSISFKTLDLEAGENARIKVIDPNGVELEGERITQPKADERYSKASFTTEDAGLYTITVEKLDADGEVMGSSTYTTYKTFAYSKEYDMFVPAQKSLDFMNDMAVTGKGISLTSASDAYIAFEANIYKVYDPRMLFMILSIILLLLDIAVRKFKFKWLHEIIRDNKEKKALQNKRR